MQFIEQRFKLIVGNFVCSVCGALWHRRLNRRVVFDLAWRAAFTVQLIQQLFKFIIGDIVAGTSGRGCGGATSNLATAMQLVQQSIEFIIADFITAGGC